LFQNWSKRFAPSLKIDPLAIAFELTTCRQKQRATFAMNYEQAPKQSLRLIFWV
jgi:hypothetical protein